MSRSQQPDSPAHGADVFVAPEARYGGAYDESIRAILDRRDLDFAKTCLASLPDRSTTPLASLDEFAGRCGVAAITVKLEGERRPTGSFKVLGPPLALAVQLARRLSGSLAPDAALVSEIMRGERAQDISRFTTVAATSGNHGRALAWAARQFGCRCQIFMPAATGAVREQAIRGWGAETSRIAGVYDRSVEAAVAYESSHDAILVGDGASEQSGVRRHILHGYAVLGDEWLADFFAGPVVGRSTAATVQFPTHLFLPAGSGTLAAGILARWWLALGASRPKVIIVQPRSCNSAIRSARADRLEVADGDLLTLMDGLSVGQISGDAWRIFRSGAFGYVAVSEEHALQTLRAVADTTPLQIGETGIAALAGLLAATSDSGVRQQLQFNADSRIGLIATEGITDPEVYRRLLQ